MQEIEIPNWAALSALCEQLAIGDWIFRGVENGDYQLIPAIGRVGARRSFAGHDLPYDGTEAAEMLRRFKIRSRALVSLPADADDLEWWALGRHHGLPTPVLDWTTSLFTAAYFACSAGGVVRGVSCRAAVYAVACPERVATFAEAERASDPVAHYPPHISPRIAAQNALLTYHPQPQEAWQPIELIKAWIGPKASIEIKKILARAGINESSMMPGLDGIAAFCGWEYKREFFRHVSLEPSSGRAWDKGVNAKGERQFHVQMERDPNYGDDRASKDVNES